MARYRYLLVAAASALLLVGGVSYTVWSLPAEPPLFYSAEPHGPRPAPDCHSLTPSCPETIPQAVLEAPWFERAIAFQFLPPPQGTTPLIDASEALDIAWQEGGVLGTKQQATLALVPRGGDFPIDVVVWIVRYDGACITPSGRPGVTPDTPCQQQPYWTVIDAVTGDFILSWTRPE
jgi:hypothetical protein